MCRASCPDPTKKYPKPPVECFHGGQSYRDCPNFKCDFSVATNISGPPKSAIAAAKQAFVDLEHYPDQDAWAPRCHLADYLQIDPMEVLVGNGASELIDVILRIFPPATTWRPGPWGAQYLEFARAAESSGLQQLASDDASAHLTILVNPNSPTGDFFSLDELRKLLRENPSQTFVINESFLPYAGPNWRELSAMNLIKEFGDRVLVVTSWTKVFACPLIRLGTVVSTRAMCDRVQKIQAPWSVNGFAQAFFIAALHEEGYFNEMWEQTPVIRREMEKLLSQFGTPNAKSPDWVPYVYLDMGSAEIASRAEKVAFDAGLPVRNCASFGKPQFVRVAVRPLEFVHQLVDALKSDNTLTELMAARKQ